LILTWIFALLNREVNYVKKAPNHVPDEQNPFFSRVNEIANTLFRLAGFFIQWAQDILNGFRGMIVR
jgi:hypothetical protein